MRDYGNARVRPARSDDAVALAPKLRAADLAEIDARSGRSPLTVLLEGILFSKRCFAVELKSGEVVALFGVAPSDEPRLGLVWMLGSDRLLDIRFTFLRHSREWLRELSRGYSVLGNFVDERNTVHVAWLRWLGFRFLSRAPMGRNGETFLEFVRLPETDDPISNV